MIYTVKKGKHRAKPLRFGLWRKRESFQWDIRLNSSTRYNLKSDDQFDLNKLIGIYYITLLDAFLWPFILLINLFRKKKIPLPHHRESFRLTYADDLTADKLSLHAYWYINSVRGNQFMSHIETGKYYTFSFFPNHKNKTYTCSLFDKATGEMLFENIWKFSHNKKWQRRLGPYFGGNNPAPHKMTFEINPTWK